MHAPAPLGIFPPVEIAFVAPDNLHGDSNPRRVVGENPVRFIVYCQAGNVPHSAAVRDWATNVLGSVGAEVLFDAAEAAEILKREAGQQMRF